MPKYTQLNGVERIDPTGKLREYMKARSIEPQGTVEGTVNQVLEKLASETQNYRDGQYRDELLSSCSVILNGLQKIKDPVKLYRNLAAAFERRGSCIFTNTVKNAFRRLQRDAMKKANAGQIKAEEIIRAIESARNSYVRTILAAQLPRKYLESLLGRKDSAGIYRGTVAELISRRDLTAQELKALLHHPDYDIRRNAAYAATVRAGASVAAISKLLRSNTPGVSQGAKAAIWEGMNPSLHVMQGPSKYPNREIRYFAAQGAKKRQEHRRITGKSTLKFNHGLRVHRSDEIKRLTGALRR